jgi:hypothetical protein
MNSTYNHSKKVSRVSFIDDDTKQNKSKIQLESMSKNDSFEIIKSVTHKFKEDNNNEIEKDTTFKNKNTIENDNTNNIEQICD